MSDRETSGDVTLIGFGDLDRKFRKPEWMAAPAGRFLDKWRFSVQRQAVANMRRGPGGWVDTGQTRQSLTSERDDGDPMPNEARVGSNLNTARWGEYGTGRLSEDPESSHRPYWPPASALEPWAVKHGFGKGGGGFVAAIIGRRGGTAPRRFLRNAVETTTPKIPGWVAAMAKEVEAEAGRA